MHQLPFFSPAHRELADPIDAFARQHIDPAAARDESHTLDTARGYVAALASGGWLARIVPDDIRSACLIRERLAYSSSLADSMFAMQGLGGLPIAMFGSDAQRAQWFNKIREGLISGFALTEPDAGSDPAGMKLAAVRDGDLATGGYRLSGEKTFISNAGIAGVFVVFARLAGVALTSDSDRLSVSSNADDAPQFIALIVPGDAPGLTADPIHLIAPHPLGTLRFENVVVPAANRLGAEGDGLRIALGTLDQFRATVGAAACGMARRALDEAIAHVKQREQFGKSLSKNQGVQFMLAEMATELAAAQLLVAKAAWMVDGQGFSPSPFQVADSLGRGESRGESLPSVPSTLTPDTAIKQAVSMSKLFATDHAHAIIDRAVQLLGGRGLVSGHPVERLYREVRALRIYEGTSEIQKLVIARTLL